MRLAQHPPVEKDRLLSLLPLSFQTRVDQRSLEEHDGVRAECNSCARARGGVVCDEKEARVIPREPARTGEQESLALIAKKALVVGGTLAPHVPQAPPNLHADVVPTPHLPVQGALADSAPATFEGCLQRRRQLEQRPEDPGRVAEESETEQSGMGTKVVTRMSAR